MTFKSTVKRVSALTIGLLFTLTFLWGLIAFGEDSIIQIKSTYNLGEPMTIKLVVPSMVTKMGISEDDISAANPYLALFKNKVKDYYDSRNYSELTSDNTWETNAPMEAGSFEVRLYANINGKDSVVANVPFTVVSPKAKTGDVTLSKTNFTVNEDANVIIKGLNENQSKNGWVGIFKAGVGNDKYEASENTERLIDDSSKGGLVWDFKAPPNFGDYELRVFTKYVSGDKEQEPYLYAKIPFKVGSTTSSKDDVKLNSDFFLVKDKVTVTVNSDTESKTGLTYQQVQDGAWVGLYNADDDVNRAEYIDSESFRDLGKTPYQWTFDASINYGKYKVVVFTKYLQKEDRSKAQYNTTPMIFTVGSKPAKDGDVTLSKKDYLVGDNATLKIKDNALTVEQIKDGAWFGVFNATDSLEARPISSGNADDIQNKKFTIDFEVPPALGGYELRVFTKYSTDKDILKQALFKAVPFNVVSIKSNDKNDVKTDNGKQKFSKGEAINLIIKCYNSQAESEQAIANGKSGGISPGQIKHGAWAGLFKLGDANSAQAIMSVNLDDNSTIRRKTSDGSLIWNIQAPLTAGEYIVKVFTQETDKDKRDPVFFAELPITVTNTTKITESQGAFDWANYIIQVTPKPITVKVGSSVTLNVVAKPKAGKASATPTTVNNLVTFTITDKDAKGKEKNIATVKLDSLGKGVITGLKTGTTKLYITPKGNSKYGIMVQITVKGK